ncbi:probable ATP-dependent RNA helicase DDX49 [Oscarella lobularis]|uniref:probable ATP-dependent RNA helicase DDX49 n=1 Tax=Oscarella lobularis TaxID=121494 RepID=UPI003314443B
MSFSSLGLSEWIVRQCAALRFRRPTEIQLHCIPPILQGKSCMGCAKTGSGKTAAFALPILQHLAADPYGIYALVLTPTRELAYQIADQFRAIGKPIGLRVAVVIGGMDMMRQSIELSSQPHVVVATPGRLADHLQSSDTFHLQKIKFLVLDEADRLLEASFADDLSVIFDAVPTRRQTLLFSATLTDALKDLKDLAGEKPVFYEAKSEIATVDELHQKYVLMPAKVKDCYMIHLLRHFCKKDDCSVIVFTSTCRNCQILAQLLSSSDFSCAPLHSLLSQRSRLASLAKFKSNQVKILVATDVASRGLDIPTVQVVLNANVPADPKDYIHRVGRTARAGRGGLAVTLVTQYDVKRIQAIEKRIGTTLTDYSVAEKDVLTLLNEVTIARREIELKLSKSSFGEKREINRQKRKFLEESLAAKKHKMVLTPRERRRKTKSKIPKSTQKNT